MKTLNRYTAILAASFLAASGTAAASELILLHGHIYTGVSAAPWAEALGITGGSIDAVGTDAAIAKRRTAKTRVIDLHGRTVIPGIVDSHIHFLFGAQELHGFNLSEPAASITPDKPELLVARIREFAASHPAERILIGRGDFSASPPFAPTHELLDRAVSDRPLIIHGTFEHSLWVNARALALAGITDAPVADPDEERNIVRDASGHPTGVLIESAMQVVERAVQKTLTTGEQLAMLRDASRYLNRYGITSVVNATGDLEELRLLAALRDRGELTVRTRSAFGAVAVPHRLTAQFLADLETARTTWHDDWLSANLVKLFADGSTGQIPPLVYEPHQFQKLVAELDRRGYQLMTHAERDDSVHMILDAYADAVRANGPRDRRLRIEHAFVTASADVPRFGSEGVIASMQPIFCCSEIGTNYNPKETNPSDRWNSIVRGGGRLAMGSDWPCAWPPDPFANIQETVTREVWASPDTAGVMNQAFDGAAQAGGVPTGATYSPEERLTAQEALDGFTQGAAYAAFFDQRVGTLEVGKAADLAVLSQDPLAVAAQAIGRTRVVMTLVGGRTVYKD